MTASPSAPSAARLRYRLRLPEPERHLAEVELRLPGAADLGDTIELAMPAWCPGSYLIRDYARFVRDLEATGAGGRPLRARKLTKQRWGIERDGADEVIVRYRVWGHDLSVRTNHIDATHAFLHGPATYLYADALRDRPCEVVVETPGRDWPVVTGLERREDGAYAAAGVDELLDCPIHAGAVDLRSFEAAGKPAALAVWGRPDAGGVASIDDLVGDLAAIVEAHAARMGGVPYRDYTFLLMLSPNAYGGLEHCTSSANLSPPFALATRKSYERLLELLSHEFFHVWNGKRLYPAALSPFDYARENYTRCLWVVEGLTSYYDRYTVKRAGRIRLQRYLETLAEEWGRLRSIPGRRRHSVEEASFDAWIKLYRPDASNLNTTVSYYLKGGLVMLALDLDIRRRSGGTRCLDDGLRLLWERFGSRGEGYGEDAVQAVLEEAAGVSLGEFFERFIRGREDPPLADLLATAGLELGELHKPEAEADGRQPAWLGVNLAGASTRVAAVLDGGPGEAAGLGAGDEIIAVDGYRVGGAGALRERLSARAPGDRVALALFRRDQLLEVPVELAAAPPDQVEIRTAARPTPAQAGRFEEWLGEPFPSEPVVVTGSAPARV